MGLASALTTALTGLNAAETQIDVVGNNLANSQTVGFKSSTAIFSTQFLQTLGLGSAPTANTGGTNPRQTGLGTQVSEITPNFTQGTIEVSSNPSDLAIQGDGFFMVQGTSGETLYTRNGIFKTNSSNELVTTTGQRLLGFGVDDFFQVQTTQLVPLSIPLGASAVAQATQNVYLEGTLTPTGDVADTAEVIQSAIMGDASIPRPVLNGDTNGDGVAENPPVSISGSIVPSVSSTVSGVMDKPDISVAPALAGATLNTGDFNTGDVVSYRVVLRDSGTGATTFASDAFQVTVTDGGDANNTNNSVRLTNLPQSASYDEIQIYRTAVGGGSYALLNTVAMGTTQYDDTVAAPAFGAALPASLVNGPAAGGGHAIGEVYQYRFAFVDDSGTETVASSTVTRTVTGTGGEPLTRSIVLADLPRNASYSQLKIYRTQAGGSTFYGLDTIPMPTGASDAYIDDDSITLDTSAANALDQAVLNGNYTYVVTFFRDGLPESRPSLPIGAVSVVDGRVRLSNLPIPPVPGATDTFPAYDTVRIYRNLANDSNTFYWVGDVDPGEDFTDHRTDLEISQPPSGSLPPAGQKVDRDGPKITPGTLLTNVVQRDGHQFTQMFQLGTLTFTGRKGDRSLASKDLTITSTTTVQDLIEFMQESLGIQTGDDIPTSLNTILGETDSLEAGGQPLGGRIRLVSNNGVDNAVSVGLSSFVMRTTKGEILNPNLNFSSIQTAVGQSAVTDFVVFDSLGQPVNVRLTAVLESRTGTATTYRWFADSPNNDPVSGSEIAVGTGLVSFDGEGNLITASNNVVDIERRNSPASSPLEFRLDFSAISGLAQSNSEIAAARQDGSSTGTLTSFIIGEDGVIRGVFSNGVSRDLGQVRLARFSNPAGLEQKGQNLYAAGVNSGLPIQGNPGEQGIGTVIAGAVELSNTDIGANLIDLVLATTQYRGNTRVITAAQQLLDELLNLRR